MNRGPSRANSPEPTQRPVEVQGEGCITVYPDHKTLQGFGALIWWYSYL